MIRLVCLDNTIHSFQKKIKIRRGEAAPDFTPLAQLFKSQRARATRTNPKSTAPQEVPVFIFSPPFLVKIKGTDPLGS